MGAGRSRGLVVSSIVTVLPSGGFRTLVRSIRPQEPVHVGAVMRSTTYNQARALADGLAKAKDGPLAWQLGQVINALLAQAKQEHPDNVAIAALEPFEESAHGGTTAYATMGSAGAVLGQIIAATDPRLGQQADALGEHT
jgi:hypothetical protein